MKILFPASNWASNIGNPFFTLGVEYAVRKAYPGAEVIPVASSATLPLKLRGKMKENAFNYVDYAGAADAIMFAGPMFDLNFREFFAPAFTAAKKQGLKILLVSAGSINYDPIEIEHCRSVLTEFQPELLWTRDAETFEIYRDLAKHAHSGVCGAWFSPDYYPGYDTPMLSSYICSVFDFRPEPSAQVLARAIKGDAELPGEAIVNTNKISRIQRVLQRGLPDRVDENKVIRLCHRPANNPRSIFNNPNTFAAFTPFGYLNLFRNGQVTVTDRLHASVVTLAYGKPAYLYLRSKRGHLLRAAGIEYDHGKRLNVDQEYLKKRKDEVVNFLSSALGKVV